MSTFHKMKDGYTMITKGAVDVMLKRVDYIQKGGKIFPVTEVDVENICRVNEQYSESGLRVLGIGYRHFPVEKISPQRMNRGWFFWGYWQ